MLSSEISSRNRSTRINDHLKIKYPINVVRFANLMETTYSGCFLFVVGNNMLMMSVTALQVRFFFDN